MKTAHVALFALAAIVVAGDSIAGSDAGRVVIPPLVEKASLPVFDEEAFPDDKSKAPKPSEWKDAKEVRPTRAHKRVETCKTYRLREWLKIHCDHSSGGLRLLAGSSDGVELWLGPTSETAQIPQYNEVVFPIRRGDRRIFETFDFEFGEWDGFGTSVGMTVEELWPEGQAKPTVTLL